MRGRKTRSAAPPGWIPWFGWKDPDAVQESAEWLDALSVLPRPCETVLLCRLCGDRQRLDVGYRNKSGVWYIRLDNGKPARRTENVIYWMHIPPLPRGIPSGSVTKPRH